MALWVDKFVHVNPFTRPGLKLTAVRKIITHYTANPGATALNHFKYFDKTCIELKRSASAHIFVDKTEAYCIIPLNEIAYAANDGAYRGVPELKPNANFLSVSVELCIEKDGSFHPDTIERAAAIHAELCKRFNLDPLNDIVRHYDVTHKNCPAPWVANVQGFKDFKQKVKSKLVAVKEGWKLENNIWYFYKGGQAVKNNWAKDSKGKWFYLGENGAMVTDKWVLWKNEWYYMGKTGEMATGLITVAGKKYFLQDNGVLLITNAKGEIQ